MYSFNFSIGGIHVSLKMPHSIIITDGFKPFATDKQDDSVEVVCYEVEKLKFPKEQSLFSNIIFSVYEDRDGYYRVFHDHKENDRPYAIGRIISNVREEIYYLSDSRGFFSESQNTFSHIALEELLLRNKAMILHAAFVNTEHGGILFSGTSGIGKSTQADLWEKYRNAELINGDRTILKRDEKIWKGYGSPYAGSSRCFVNKSAQIAAIVMLKQSEECCIQRLSPVQAFCKIYSGMIINIWNPIYVSEISALIEALVKEVPVYLLSCTPKKEAVDLLNNTLYEITNEGGR